MLLQLILRKAEDFAPVPDGDAALLGRFIAERDEAAFAALLQRHGAMVWSVCRHLLADEADAEDAFQATFLALVRQAKRVRNPEALGAWLHGVAVRISTKAKQSAARRRRREEKAAEPESDRPIPDAAWNQLLAAVHEEVQRLPESLRAAFVMCELEGVRQPDAAARLGWKPGTLTGRLTRARQAIVRGLTNRGLAPALAGGGLVLGATTATATVPQPVMDMALALIHAGGSVPPAILQLVKEATPMATMRTKLAALTLLVGGLGAVIFPMAVAQPPVGPGRGAAGGGPPPVGGGAPAGAAGFNPVAAPAVKQPWEYRFVPTPTKDLEKSFADLGNDGWEFCSPLGTGNLLVFKRAKGMPFNQGFGAPGGGMNGFGVIPGAGAPPGFGGAGLGGAGGGNAPKPVDMPLAIIQLKNSSALDMVSVIERVFKNGVTATAESRTNTLILRGDERALAEVKSLIEKLEKAERP